MARRKDCFPPPPVVSSLRDNRLAEIQGLITRLNTELQQAADLHMFVMLRLDSVQHSPTLTRPAVELVSAQVHEVLYKAPR